MGLFDRFTKKTVSPEDPVVPQEPLLPEPVPAVSEEYLDDITYIQEMKHIENGPWHQYDILLAAQPYGWNYMVMTEDYLASQELEAVSEVVIGELGLSANNITESYRRSGSKLAELPEAAEERGMLSIAGISKVLGCPLKLVMFNQTRVIRFFTFESDESTIRKYAESVVRRNFHTKDAMKPGKPIPQS